MIAWRNAPHVREWWDPDDPPLTLEEAVAKYHPRIMQEEGTTSCIIEFHGKPYGYIQFYQWIDDVEAAREMGFVPNADWWGVDVFIGEPDGISRGIGSQAVALMVEHLCASKNAKVVALTVDINNARAIRAYEKAGFRRDREVLDTDMKQGERIRSWLMLAECEHVDGR